MTPRALAPIILFAYHRPAHAARTLQTLQANRLAADSRLYVFCDGPPPDASAELRQQIAAVRAVVRQATGFAEVTVSEAETNRGLMVSIEQGIRAVLAQHDRVIVLEDDLELSPGFLEYMNAALDAYAAEETVMSVTGYMFPVEEPPPETFFLHMISSWGWGTWRRAFVHYQPDAAALMATVRGAGRLEEFNLDGTYDFMGQLQANAKGHLRTWAVKWYATVFLRGGLTLFPGRSLVRNFGHDGSGQHSACTSQFDVSGMAEKVVVEPEPVVENPDARRAVGKLLAPAPRPRSNVGLRRWLRETVRRFLPA